MVEVRDRRNGDWYWIHRAVYEKYTKKIGAIGLALYNAYCSYARDSGEAWPSQKTIARGLDISVRTLIKFNRILERERLIEITSGKADGQTNKVFLLKLNNAQEVQTPGRQEVQTHSERGSDRGRQEVQTEREAVESEAMNEKHLVAGKPRPAKPSASKRGNDMGLPGWQDMIDHICATWKAKRGAPYPFTAKHARLLHRPAGIYGANGMRALWDAYLRSDDEWVRDMGWNIETFLQRIPRLIDDPDWKAGRDAYLKAEAVKGSLANPPPKKHETWHPDKQGDFVKVSVMADETLAKIGIA